MFKFLSEIYKRRHLLSYLVFTDLKQAYSNKLLGYFWSILDPLAMMGVYTLLVHFIFKRGSPQFPVLLFSALLSWKWFASSTTSSVTSLTSNARVILSVRFPTGILPLAEVFTNMIRYLLGLLALIPLLFFFNATFSFQILWFPVLLFIQFLFTVGLCWIFAIVGVLFRDLHHILGFTLRMWFYLSPALYMVEDQVPERFQFFYMLNPFSALFESYKFIFVLGRPPSVFTWVALFVSVLIFILGVEIFRRNELRITKEF